MYALYNISIGNLCKGSHICMYYISYSLQQHTSIYNKI